MGDTWHLDELFVTIQGRQQYLWRAVDEDGDVIDILVQSRRNQRAAVRFFRKLLKREGHVPRRLVTDKLRSYPAAHRAVMPSVVHCTDQYANNRAEVSHQATRQRERQMRRFKSAAQLQRFASVHGVVQNLFRGWAPAALVTAIASLSFLGNFESITKGIVDLPAIVFYLSLIAFALFANKIIIDQRKAA